MVVRREEYACEKLNHGLRLRVERLVDLLGDDLALASDLLGQPPDT
jgi:hypothetical protein